MVAGVEAWWQVWRRGGRCGGVVASVEARKRGGGKEVWRRGGVVANMVASMKAWRPASRAARSPRTEARVVP